MSKNRNFDNRKKFNRFKGQKFYNKGPHVKREYTHQEQLTECEVGITEFISKLEGFSGIIKARYSDFHVNEIDPDGNIAKLTNTLIPKDFICQKEKLDYKTIETTPLTEIPQETWVLIKQMCTATDLDPNYSVDLDATNLTKENRKQIHECVKNAFGQKVVASTIDKDEKKYIQFKVYNKATDTDKRLKWPEDKGEYVHFLVYKEAIDTLDACMKISDCVRMPSSAFNYAGVKDKRAKTTQWFSVKKVEPWKLIIKTKPLRNIKIGNITFKDKPLKLGQLLGNKFRIALRNVSGEDTLINSALESLKLNGFINYYGLQRFGNDKEVPTFSIGLNLLLAKWKEAVDLILKPKTSDDPILDITKAKKIFFETRDAEKALKEFKNKNTSIEAKLLGGLQKGHANEFVNALESIPRNMRLLYIHSFQSLIWNEMASIRIKEYGLEPVVGDLVFAQEIGPSCGDEEEEEGNSKVQDVKVLTQEDLTNYTIFDVVLPLPGYDIIYPEHLKSWYEKALQKHGLNLEMTKQSVKTYTLSGAYRKLMEKVQNLTWKIILYNDPVASLIRSDFEELKGDKEPESVENGKYKALVIDFTLNSSSYATMVLREILKTDTSSSSHAKLNNYHEPTKELKNISYENVGVQEKHQEITQVPSTSLLSNQDKYEEFKNNLFNNLVSEKRKNEDNDQEEGSKKAKLEGDNSISTVADGV